MSTQGRRDQPGEAPHDLQCRETATQTTPSTTRWPARWLGGACAHTPGSERSQGAPGTSRGGSGERTWPLEWTPGGARPAATTRRPLPGSHRLLGRWGTEGSLRILQLVGTGSQKLPTKAEICANSPTRTETPPAQPKRTGHAPGWQATGAEGTEADGCRRRVSRKAGRSRCGRAFLLGFLHAWPQGGALEGPANSSGRPACVTAGPPGCARSSRPRQRPPRAAG